MKLRRTEKMAIVVTVAAFLMLAGYGIGVSSAGDGVFYVHTEKDAPKEALMLGGDVDGQTGAAAVQTDEKADVAASVSEKININTATAEQLQALPGIGEVRARSIVEYREENGGFDSTDCIMDVGGIGEKIYGQLKDLITVAEGES